MESAGLRRMIINAAYWGMGMETAITPTRSVEIVGEYKPLETGFDYGKTGVVSHAVEWSDKPAAGSWSSSGVTEQILTDNGTAQTVRVCRGCRHWTEAVDAAQSNVVMKTRANVIFGGRHFARQGVASSDRRNAARARLLWQNTTVSHIAWESEVWIAEDPDHMIHFNGERFLGPYPDVMPTNSPRSVPQ